MLYKPLCDLPAYRLDLVPRSSPSHSFSFLAGYSAFISLCLLSTLSLASDLQKAPFLHSAFCSKAPCQGSNPCWVFEMTLLPNLILKPFIILLFLISTQALLLPKIYYLLNSVFSVCPRRPEVNIQDLFVCFKTLYIF